MPLRATEILRREERREGTPITAFQSILQGLVQGLTEFLPISSSGHLVLLQKILHVEEPTIFFDLVLHFGTLLSILVYFRSDFSALGRTVRDRLRPGGDGSRVGRGPWYRDDRLRVWLLIVVGSLPTFAVALFLKDAAERAFLSLNAVAVALSITSLLLGITRWIDTGGRGVNEITVRDAVVIGLAQGFAVFPGVSRSGTTIVAGMVMGLRGRAAAKFSFLLSIPVVIGAIALEILEQGGIVADYDLAVELLGCAVAFGSGLFAIRSVLGLVNVGRLYLFSFYCLALGLAVLGAVWLL